MTNEVVSTPVTSRDTTNWWQLIELVMDKNQLNSLLLLLSDTLGCSKSEALKFSLEFTLSKLEAGAAEGLASVPILDAAGKLVLAQGGFTMDELLDYLSERMPIFAPHKTKIFAARVLNASGYERKQCRRGKERPLLWQR